jgi:hypothetical protein
VGTYTSLPADNNTSWGTTARTVFASIPGLDLGAGGTADDSSAVSTALSTVSGLGGGAVIGRPGATYTCLDVAWPSNVGIIGNGATFKTPAGTADNHALFNATGTTTATSGNVANIWARDCLFQGTVATDAFVQHRHLIVLGGVTNAAFDRCRFVGFQGDGAYLGHLGGSERHNENVSFVRCTFDGVNQDNRNCISVIDCHGLYVNGCQFQNSTRTDMPGAIDIEPNAGNTWAVVRNIRIVGNGFRNIRAGIAGVISMNVPIAQASLTSPVCGIVIANNTIEFCPNSEASIFLQQSQVPGATTARNDIVVSNNVARNSGRPFELSGVRGVSFDSNTWNTTWGAAVLGFSNLCRDIDVNNDTFANIGGSNGVEILRTIDLTFDGCTWDTAGTTQLLRFDDLTASGASTGSTDKFDFIRNKIQGTAPTAILAVDAGHTITSTSNNRAYLNRWNGLSTTALTNVFAAGNTANNL